VLGPNCYNSQQHKYDMMVQIVPISTEVVPLDSVVFRTLLCSSCPQPLSSAGRYTAINVMTRVRCGLWHIGLGDMIVNVTNAVLFMANSCVCVQFIRSVEMQRKLTI